MDSPPVGNDEITGICAGGEKALTVEFPDGVKGYYAEAIADEHIASFFS